VPQPSTLPLAPDEGEIFIPLKQWALSKLHSIYNPEEHTLRINNGSSKLPSSNIVLKGTNG
jgi:hypothetical protein